MDPCIRLINLTARSWRRDQHPAAAADREAVPVGLAGEDHPPELQEIPPRSVTVDADADAEQLRQLADEHGQDETGGLKTRSTRQLP